MTPANMGDSGDITNHHTGPLGLLVGSPPPPPEAPFDDLFAFPWAELGVMTHFLDPRDELELGVTFWRSLAFCFVLLCVFTCPGGEF
jgi:hypothetical protein